MPMPMTIGTSRSLLFDGIVLPTVDFNLANITFTARMAKRAGPGPFAASPIVQGDWDGTGTPDVLSYSRGSLLGNATQYWYDQFDPYQGTIVMWLTPEWDGDDGLQHIILDFGAVADLLVRKLAGNTLSFAMGGQATAVDVSAWTAGTTYLTVLRWDTKNTLDGTNYGCITVNGAHDFGITTAPVADDPNSTLYIGSSGSGNAADAIPEGIHISRRIYYETTSSPPTGQPLTFDGSGYIDELAAIYAAGAGADPSVIVGGSWDTPFCLPTDSTPGILATGTGEAWNHPYDSALGDHPWQEDGYMGTDWAVAFNATTTSINCGSDVDIDDIADDAFTVEAWVRADAAGETSSTGVIICKRGALNVGWQVSYSTTQIVGTVYCATTNAQSKVNYNLIDGKWHHLVMFFDDAGDRKSYIAIDGVWQSYDTQNAGVGVINSDAARNLTIGELGNGTYTFDGAIGWVAISNNDRHSHGTDFIPPRIFPADDANYLASWNMNDGTGAGIANTGNQGGAGSGAANRDGTASNHTWEAQWNPVLTPVVPQSLQFFQENDGIDFGSGANIDDLPDGGDFTAECWIKIPAIAVISYFLGKTDAGASVGWWLRATGSGSGVSARIYYDGTVCGVTSGVGGLRPDEWHHVALDWDQGTLTGRLFIDGVFMDTSTAVGNYIADAGEDCLVNARGAIGTTDDYMNISWIRLSDNRRYTGNSFLPPARNAPPGNDANAQLLIDMTDGAGTTATDTSGNGYNGTITFGATTRWNNTPDLSIDEPSAMVYQNGYSVGSDSPDDGVGLLATVTAETSYVCRAPVSYSNSRRGQPAIQINAVLPSGIDIVTFLGPKLSGIHTGSGNAANLEIPIGSGVFPASLIGGDLYNITKKATATITDVSGTNQEEVVALASGWFAGDEFMIVPPDRLWCEPFVFTTPLGCTQIEARGLNRSGEDILGWHQFEIQESLAQNGDHESLTGGNPDLITGWTTGALDLGDTEAEAVIAHSGSQSLEWNTGAVDFEYMGKSVGGTIGNFYMRGAWIQGDGSVGIDIGGLGTNRSVLQADPSISNVTGNSSTIWAHNAGVWRYLGLSNNLLLVGVTGASGDRFTDDAYMFELNNVTLTATAAIEADSLEGAGIRIDGRDGGLQTQFDGVNINTLLSATYGHIRWDWTPRHGRGIFVNFVETNTSYTVRVWGDANNLIEVYQSAASSIRLRFNAGGAGLQIGTWLVGAGEIVAGTTYLMEIRYNANWMELLVDGVQRILINQPVNFTTIPTTVYWGSDNSQANQSDMVVAPPTP